MPYRAVVAKELSKILSVLSHPHRILIVEELGDGEQDVNHLTQILEISQSRVSQHLSVMRSQNLVEERREGRHVFYHLSQPDIAKWLIEGLEFIKLSIENKGNIISAVEEAKDLWAQSNSD